MIRTGRDGTDVVWPILLHVLNNVFTLTLHRRVRFSAAAVHRHRGDRVPVFKPGEARDGRSTADPNEWKTAWPIWWMVLGVFVVMVSIWLGLLMMFANQ